MRIALAQDSPSNEQGALIVGKWFRAADPHIELREELISSGVPRQTASSLYPADFGDLIPAVFTQLRQQDLNKLTQMEGLGAQASRVVKVLVGLREESKNNCRRDWQASGYNSRGMQDFIADLEVEFAHHLNKAIKTSTSFAVDLWYVWWFGNHLAELTPTMRDYAEEIICWYGENLLGLNLKAAREA